MKAEILTTNKELKSLSMKYTLFSPLLHSDATLKVKVDLKSFYFVTAVAVKIMTVRQSDLSYLFYRIYQTGGIRNKGLPLTQACFK